MNKLRNFINTRANDEGLYDSNEVDNLEKEIRADERAQTIKEMVNIQNKSYAVIVDPADDECDECFHKITAMPLEEYRKKVIDEFVEMHNKCNTNLCDKIGIGISCCDCIAEQLKSVK